MARQFDGVDDHAITASSVGVDSSTVVTLAGWVYWPEFSTDYAALAFYGPDTSERFSIFYDDPGQTGSTSHVGFYLFHPTPAAYCIAYAPRPSAATWHHLIVTYDYAASTVADQIKVWFDNSAVSLVQGTGSVDFTTETFGSHPLELFAYQGAFFWQRTTPPPLGYGQRALNSTERGNLAAGALPTTISSGLIAAYRMSAAGSTETDASGNGYTLNYTGTTVVSDPTALSGTFVTGNQASETDTANGGTPLIIQPGSQATSTHTANTGAPSISVTGSQASVTHTTNSGTPTVTVTGSQASHSSTANTGSISVIAAISGIQATTTDIANAGTPTITVTGALASETDTANAGSASSKSQVYVAGAQASETDTANTGTPVAHIVITGAQATEFTTAFSGSPSTNLFVTGSQATTTTTFSGLLSLSITGSRALETDTPIHHPWHPSPSGNRASI